ncbi:type IV pilus twitching motility protein PilT [Thermosynechococcus sichuanensis E542]|uniref:Type IV pilus twitching motility protein PilT n=1 Tax=Thermosynechococcus sichuanensis E542 TaxID=2016101 RepID=A0A7D6JSQ6_9CYAN|nr:type IV pilus twitching motility protein PilT [Thermosynechococcus vestitus]QLL29917.1 type IV pilus twitching motility protein PilT [Thermosynechococcus vestitus E542]
MTNPPSPPPPPPRVPNSPPMPPPRPPMGGGVPPMPPQPGMAPPRPAPPPPPQGMPPQPGMPPRPMPPQPGMPPRPMPPQPGMPQQAVPTQPMPTPAARISGPTMEQLVREAFEHGYSDIHVGVGEAPRFRDRGRLEITNYPVTDEETFNYWLNELLTPQQIEQFRTHLEYDGAYQYEGLCRVRINIFVALKGPAMVLRLIPVKILTLEQLNLPPVFKDLCHYHKGLILVTGPTGSGKSTTLAAMVDYINSEMPKHIISIEDPIEFVHQSRRALIRQREVGIHTLKFDNALKASLREDPDIILIGEMRDRETVNTALKAAQTGHLVFGTLHTNSAVKTIERILNLYNPDEQGPMRMQVAESLVAVIAQALVRTTDGKRAAIHEIMINTDAIKDYILRGEVEEIEAIIPQCRYDGMCTMNQCLYELYEAGRIDEETAIENSPKPNEMAQILRGRV